MKIKKKIDVEIETKYENYCSSECLFFRRSIFEDSCILFNKHISFKFRCQQCIEAFGMGEE